MEMTTADWARLLDRIKSNMLTPISSDRCPLCDGTGWEQITAEDGRKYSRECSCVKVRRCREYMRRSGLEDVLEALTFEAFKTPENWQKNAVERAKEYASSIIEAAAKREKKPWFYIGGNVGSGKTHLCTAICGELLRHNIPVMYMQWLTEARRLKAHVNEPDFEAMISPFVNASVLYIDDLFKQQSKDKPTPTDADVKIAFEIINRRYLQNLPTIISSEWFLHGELLPVDGGTFSRVAERAKDYTISIGRDASRNYRLKQ